MLLPDALQHRGQPADVRRRRGAADPADHRLARAAAVARQRAIGQRHEACGVDAGGNDRDRGVEAPRVSGKVLVAGDDLITVADDGRDLTGRLQRADEAVGVAHARQKNRVVEVEDDWRPPPHAEKPFDERRADRKHFAIDEDGVESRRIA